ncbi:hypothetical protein [Phosphitispora fastidiosa]|uniref:hypothetical protein n=1 Tax=Phosphitispora fastidiosa TaxID=2837202 RepID=UPI001E32FF60|nr:hypothetical protein [Phosphitispora fastidiosa]MBU7006297.1 hypothetical protein [Phosphitispora fastidiosa]
MRKYLISILLVLVMLLNSSTALAEVTITEFRDISLGYGSTHPIKSDEEMFSVADVVYELSFLENSFPLLKETQIPINVVHKRFTHKKYGSLGDFATRDGILYLFAFQRPNVRITVNGIEIPYNASLNRYFVSHGIGHLVRFRYLSDKDLRDYVNKIRQPDKKEHRDGYDEYYNNPEELFAEDFRSVFGSELARRVVFKPCYSRPGPEEKVWILTKTELIKEYPLTCTERLEWYKIDKEEGVKEINRCKKVWDEKSKHKDIDGAKAAHVWADQIRGAMGLPLQ